MNWAEKYTNRKDFLSLFDNEQDYVDFMFTQIIMLNFGVYCKPEQKPKEKLENT